jgi:diguanylate cyclase (GGDEF)-like protein
MEASINSSKGISPRFWHAAAQRSETVRYFTRRQRRQSQEALMLLGAEEQRQVSPITYLELVRSLFSSLVPGIITALLFAATAALFSLASSDFRLTVLAILGSALALLRIALAVRYRLAMARPDLDVAQARAAERLYGLVYLAFAATLGTFAALCVRDCSAEDQMDVVALVVGYAAGVAAGVALRPWIAVPALLLAVAPADVMCIEKGGTSHLLLAVVLATLAAGGIMSMLTRYRAAVETLEMRQLLAGLAQTDTLTGLANRLALQHRFAEALDHCGATGIVIHVFDLDRFKPVNDIYGHAVGDLLLQAIAARLARIVRDGDLAVRLGGDEFAILQTHVRHADEADLMARRIVRSISEPYSINGLNIRIGVSVGTAPGSEHGASLAALLNAADRALYRMKRGGITPFAGAGSAA